MDSFKTIKYKTDVLFKEKASKFYAFVFPITSEQDFKNELESIKQMHPQAGHHCYAFRIGVSGEKYRYSDDGEPNNSAGKPIYGQLLSSEITNVGAVVSRYFGGTKLGVGGLVSAYKEAIKLAIDENQIIISELKTTFTINYPYEQTSAINQLSKKFDLETIANEFEIKCKSIVRCKTRLVSELELFCREQQINISKS